MEVNWSTHLTAQFALLSLALSITPSAGATQCEPRTMRVTFYTCGEGLSHCLTKRGHQPIPFRTVAVGDRSLLGRWLYIEDLGGWAHASDTGVALHRNSIDIFIGEARMAPYARRLGVQHWQVGVCAPASELSSLEGQAPRAAAVADR